MIISGTKAHRSIGTETAPTLTQEMEKTKCVPIVVTEKRYFEWHEDSISVTLRNKSGSYGGGSECLIVTKQ